MWEIEECCRAEGFDLICGVDEAGRGPLAGPVCAAAVILPHGLEIPGLTDSKKLSDKKRRELFPIIQQEAIAYGIGLASREEIDEINILQATFLAMERALAALSVRPELALIDGNREKDFGLPVKTVVKGDSLSMNIAAASILAKVTRDRIMMEYDKLYPEYEYYNCDSKKGVGNYNRQGFLKLRNDFNTKYKIEQNWLMFYVMIVYAFNNQIRFNSKGEYNLPVGKRDFNAKMEEKIIKFIERIKLQNSIFYVKILEHLILII